MQNKTSGNAIHSNTDPAVLVPVTSTYSKSNTSTFQGRWKCCRVVHVDSSCSKVICRHSLVVCCSRQSLLLAGGIGRKCCYCQKALKGCHLSICAPLQSSRAKRTPSFNLNEGKKSINMLLSASPDTGIEDSLGTLYQPISLSGSRKAEDMQKDFILNFSF